MTIFGSYRRKTLLLDNLANTANTAKPVNTVNTVNTVRLLALSQPLPLRCRSLEHAGLCAAVSLALLGGCSSVPKPADWQLEAKGALDRSVAAYLHGNSRLEALELARARTELSSTGRVDMAARAELLHCASHIASLVFEPCTGFEQWRQDAAPREQAYANYLAGQLLPGNAALLPPPQQAALAGGDAALAGIADPLSRLVAAGVAFQAGRAGAQTAQVAVDTASSQGWRRPLLAWLGVQLALAEKSGDADGAGRVKRRIDLAQGTVRAAPALSLKP